MGRVTLIDYGLGNIRAFANVYRALNTDVSVASTAAELSSAERLVLPGVGAFDWAMSRLNASGFRECLDELVLEKGVPVLGVCVGMQMMASASEEGIQPGLGWINGTVRRMTGESKTAPLPHMGWNDVVPRPDSPLFKGIDDTRFYFLHSFMFVPASPAAALATSAYSDQFTSAIQEKNVIGTQFHPEKSHTAGAMLLRNFAELELC